MDIPYTVEPRPDTGIYNAKVGIWLFLASEVMLFGGLFSAYVLLRVGADEGYWPHGWLDVRFGTLNTILLALSAITTLLTARRTQIGIEARRLDGAVLLVKALGGGWRASQLKAEHAGLLPSSP